MSSRIWDSPRPLGTADWERVRLHSYWTDRILRRCPSPHPPRRGRSRAPRTLRRHRVPPGGEGEELSFTARVLAAADVFTAMTEARAHRPAYPASEAATLLMAEAAGGRLDTTACVAVVNAPACLTHDVRGPPISPTVRWTSYGSRPAGSPTARDSPPISSYPNARSAATFAHVYDKTGRRTRAGAAVFAMEHGLLHPAHNT